MKVFFLGDESQKILFNEVFATINDVDIKTEFVKDLSITTATNGNCILSQLNDIDESIDRVLLSIGTFDFEQGVDKFGTFEFEDSSTLLGALTMLCKKIKEKTNGKVCFVLPISTKNVNRKNQALSSYYQAICDVVKQYNFDIVKYENKEKFSAFLSNYLTEQNVKRKKVVLLGDSIRLMGYGEGVENSLKEYADIFQPQENCRFAKFTLRMIFDYAEMLKESDVVYWNNGQWDVCNLFGDGTFSTIEEYVMNIERIAKLLLRTSKKVIFALTTPVRNDNSYNKNSDICAFNKAVVPVLTNLGVEIDDLYSLLSDDIDGNINSKDKIHLTNKGIKICVEHISKFIKSRL